MMTANESRPDALDQAFREHEHRLWGVAYRLTGCAADADDIVQDAFARLARSAPPAGAPLRAWLLRVTVNLGIDVLRRRRRQGYPGIWLPSPVELDDDAVESAGARYDLLESASAAFLLALEALPPRRRAILILCDVLDYSAREAGDVLGMTAPNVRMTLTRARRALEAYDRTRVPATGASRAAARQALEEFLRCLESGDGATLEGLLSRDVRAMGDGGGEFASVPAPVSGREEVKRFFLTLASRLPARGHVRIELRLLNGRPAAVLRFAAALPPFAPVVVLQCDVDDEGRIAEIRSVMASRKLTALREPCVASRGIHGGKGAMPSPGDRSRERAGKPPARGPGTAPP